MTRHKIIVRTKGGPGSGHYGHAGRPGKHGGSLPSSIAMSIHTGRTAAERQAKAAGKVPPKSVIEEVAKKNGDTKGSVEKYETSDQISGGKFGKGYFITRNGSLVDISDEFGSGTNDHVGYIIGMENPEALGVDPKKIERFVEINEKLYGEGTSLDWNSPAYQKLEHDWQDELTKMWKGIEGAGNIRVREFKRQVAIDGIPMTNSFHKRMQNLVLDGKLKGGPGTVYAVETRGYTEYLQFTYEQLMAAENVRDLRQARQGLKEISKMINTAKIIITLRKGGSGSGHHGHQGRPGKHGGSLPGKGGKASLAPGEVRRVLPKAGKAAARKREAAMKNLQELEARDFQNRGASYPASNVPVYVHVRQTKPEMLMTVTGGFKNTTEQTALGYMAKLVEGRAGKAAIVDGVARQTGDYDDDWVEAVFVVNLDKYK